MQFEYVKQEAPSSPAFIINTDQIIEAFEKMGELRHKSGCKLLYSIKSLPLHSVLELAKPYVDGFSVSSLFEAKVASDMLAGQGGIHLATPGIRPDEVNELAKYCTHISCNSFSQYHLFANLKASSASLGMRLNPKLSFATDSRYDPCRQFSKLGVDIDLLMNDENFGLFKGLHFHTNFGARSYDALLQTALKLRNCLSNRYLPQLEWINLGGGYLYDEIEDNAQFIELVKELKQIFGVDVYIEPGYAVVGKAGYLLTTVLDLFSSDGKTIAVLDTSVNHLPEVFEYQRSPALYEHDPAGNYSAILAGSTCLAGDLFGEYSFHRPLRLGDRLMFTVVGAYCLVKANRFNGYNLPDVYSLSSECLRLIKSYSFEDYQQLWLNNGDDLRS